MREDGQDVLFSHANSWNLECVLLLCVQATLVPTQATVSTVTTLMDNSTQEAELLMALAEASGQAWGLVGCWGIFLVVRGQQRDGERGNWVTDYMRCAGKAGTTENRSFYTVCLFCRNQPHSYNYPSYSHSRAPPAGNPSSSSGTRTASGTARELHTYTLTCHHLSLYQTDELFRYW